MPIEHREFAPHLHTEECNIIINAYMRCEKEHPVKAYMTGYCNPLFAEMMNCFKRERIAKREKNAPKNPWRKDPKFADFNPLNNPSKG